MTLPLPGAQALLSFVAASFLLIISPGPATFYVMARARLSGRSAAAAVAGIVLGDIVLIGVAGLGFAAVIFRWPVLVTVLKILGALYLVYLAVGMLRARASVAGAASPPSGGGLLRGFLLTLGNPKAILFFSAFFPMFIESRAGHPWAASFYTLGFVFEMMNIAYFSALTLIVRQVGRLGRSRLAPIDLNLISGCGLLACAVFVLASAFR